MSLFVRRLRHVVALLLLGPAAWTQFSPAEIAQYQRRMRARYAGRRYWDASPDSLRRVLATQRADTQRLQTLECLQTVDFTTPAEDQEALVLATRLQYPERSIMRQYVAHFQLMTAPPQVQDNGAGMSPETQAKIFQPFFTTKPSGEGTGLGLSLSYDIIAKGHAGTLTVASQVGEGTTFTVQLPR